MSHQAQAVFSRSWFQLVGDAASARTLQDLLCAAPTSEKFSLVGSAENPGGIPVVRCFVVARSGCTSDFRLRKTCEDESMSTTKSPLRAHPELAYTLLLGKGDERWRFVRRKPQTTATCRLCRCLELRTLK